MIINYQPESCPQCGVNFQDYYDAMKKDFEDTHVVELAKIRNSARVKGVAKGIVKGLVVGTVLLSLSWKGPEAVGFWDHMRLFFSENFYFVSILYVATLSLFVLVDGVGKVNSQEEQQMWEQFLQAQSKTDYLRPIP